MSGIMKSSALHRVRTAADRKRKAAENFEKEILVARKFGCTLREIASAAGISNPTVLQIERRAKERKEKSGG